MAMKRPRSVEEYRELIKSVLFDLEELRMSAEYDSEGFESLPTFVGPLEQELIALRQQLEQDELPQGNEDLAMMQIVNNLPDHALPFKGSLRLINETYRQGLRRDED